MTERKRPLGYTPGAPVMPDEAGGAPEVARKRNRVTRGRRPKSNVPMLPLELMERVLAHLVDTRCDATVVLLSMTCKSLRDHIGGDARLWHRMYSHWRGPVRHETRRYGPNNSRLMTVSTVPTTPRCLPNFRMRSPSVR